MVVCDSYAQLRGSREIWWVKWADIIKVEAYKTDSWLGECLWVRITDRDGGEVAWPEEAAQWEEATVALSRYLPGCPPPDAWIEEVLKPPLQETYKVLWSSVEAG